MNTALESFVIDATREVGDKIELYVRYDGGAMVLRYPKSYPNSTILANVRLELLKIDMKAAKQTKRKRLLGKHDL